MPRLDPDLLQVRRAQREISRLSTFRHGARHALRRPANWIQLAKFCLVGASGYAVNLGVYTALVQAADLNYIAAAVRQSRLV